MAPMISQKKSPSPESNSVVMMVREEQKVTRSLVEPSPLSEISLMLLELRKVREVILRQILLGNSSVESEGRQS